MKFKTHKGYMVTKDGNDLRFCKTLKEARPTKHQRQENNEDKYHHSQTLRYIAEANLDCWLVGLPPLTEPQMLELLDNLKEANKAYKRIIPHQRSVKVCKKLCDVCKNEEGIEPQPT